MENYYFLAQMTAQSLCGASSNYLSSLYNIPMPYEPVIGLEIYAE